MEDNIKSPVLIRPDMTVEQIKAVHTSRNINDFSGFIEGDYEPSLGKIIDILIIKHGPFIVYIDTEGMIEWSTSEDFEWDNMFKENPKFENEFGLVINRVGYLEEVATGMQWDANLLVTFKRLLAESIGRMLDEGSTGNSIIILNQAEAFFNERKRKDVLYGAVLAFSVFALIGLISYMWVMCFASCKGCVVNDYNYRYIISIVFGALGGLLSIIQRGSGLVIEPSLSASMCRLEGITRVCYGAIAALLFILARNCGLLLNIQLNPKETFDLILLFSIVVGYSERFIPSFMSKIEDSITKK